MHNTKAAHDSSHTCTLGSSMKHKACQEEQLNASSSNEAAVPAQLRESPDSFHAQLERPFQQLIRASWRGSEHHYLARNWRLT